MASLPPTVLTRVLLGVLVGALCGVVATSGLLLLGAVGDDDPVVLAPSGAPSGPTSGASAQEPATAPRDRAREVLRRWDAARARAWASGDTAALAALYTPRSVAGARDVAMLRAWTARGARVCDLTTQVLRLQVLADRERRLVLVVTDRVARVQVAGVGSPTLPRDRASTRRIELVRSGGTWRVASVVPEVDPEVSPGPPARS